ncbi:MAG TPA: CBS domain-containing protein [Mycobacteriales bacterium]|nr:CBS domain-containing protein [Mycobacteriales bacterium]
MKATQIMSAPIVTVRPDTTILQAARHLVLHKTEALPVVDSHRRLVGVVSESDLFRATAAGVRNALVRRAEYEATTPVYVKEIMRRDVLWVRSDDSLELCTQLMWRHNGQSLPVLRGGQLVGLITQRDLLGALSRIGGGPGGDQSIRATAGTGAIDIRTREALEAAP